MSPENAMSFWLWAGRLWPFIFTSLFLVMKHKQINKKIIYFIYGVLGCFGVQWMVGQFSLSMPVAYTGAQGSPEQIFSMALNSVARAVIVSVIFGVAALRSFAKALK